MFIILKPKSNPQISVKRKEKLNGRALMLFASYLLIYLYYYMFAFLYIKRYC